MSTLCQTCSKEGKPRVYQSCGSHQVDRELYYEERVLEKEVADGPEAATTEQQQRISVHEARPVGSEDIARGRHYSLVVARWKCTSVDNSDFLTVRQVHALSSSIQSTHVQKLSHSRLNSYTNLCPHKTMVQKRNFRSTCVRPLFSHPFLIYQQLPRYLPVFKMDFMRLHVPPKCYLIIHAEV